MATEIVVAALVPWQGITRDRFKAMGASLPARMDGAKITLMLDGEAGTEEVMTAALRRGRIHFGQFTVPGIATGVPEMALLMAPYLFESFEEEDFVLDGYIMPVARKLFAERGMELFSFSDSGWFIAFSKKPTPTPDAAKGQRLRAAGGDASRLFLTALGADVVEMPFADLIPALQTGMVQGGVTNMMMYENANLVREAPHLIMTRHAVNPGANVANKAWFEKLPPAHQALIRGGLGSISELRAGMRGEMEQALNNMRLAGAKIYEPTVEELRVWKERGWSTHAELIDRLGGKSRELYEAIIAGKEAYAASIGR
jgi:TRAP-type C4-dicarboxylate transport system substrate-binding protein